MPTYIVGDIHITDTTADQAHVPRAPRHRFPCYVAGPCFKVNSNARIIFGFLRRRGGRHEQARGL